MQPQTLQTAAAAFLLTGVLPLVCAAQGIFEVDLLFPQNGSTFSNAVFAPVVVAVQNYNYSWNLQASVSYSLLPWGPDGYDAHTNISIEYSGPHGWDLAVALQDDYGPADLRPGPGVLAVNTDDDPPIALLYGPLGLPSFLFHRVGEWQMTWQVQLEHGIFTPESGNLATFADVVYFNTTTSGPTADLVAATTGAACDGSAATALNVTHIDPAHQVVAPNPLPDPNPCLVHINATLASSIMAQMTPAVCSYQNGEFASEISACTTKTAVATSGADGGSTRRLWSLVAGMAIACTLSIWNA